jgi:hypothetical protein
MTGPSFMQCNPDGVCGSDQDHMYDIQLCKPFVYAVLLLHQTKTSVHAVA